MSKLPLFVYLFFFLEQNSSSYGGILCITETGKWNQEGDWSSRICLPSLTNTVVSEELPGKL